MDYQNLRADVERFLTRHFSQGRDGHEIDKVVIHHNAGCLSVDDIYNVWQSREASAHYQVTEDGTVGQLVHDWDTAWHAGSWAANSTSIGVEHANCGGPNEGWPISDATVIAGARLVAALCWGYNLGRPEWCVNVFPHQYFSSTACPGQLATTHRETEKKLDSIRELAHDAKEQTTNNHGTNLRDDIDKLDEKLDHIAQTQSLLGQELTAHGHVLDQLQAAQRQDRAERMTLDSQAHDEHERLWKELDRIKNRL